MRLKKNHEKNENLIDINKYLKIINNLFLDRNLKRKKN